jgi:anhydro-N-acetylmuramic acid kinase
MSGTSLDGVDAALIETDGETIARFGPTSYRPYREAERSLLRAALREAETLTDRRSRPGILGAAEAMVTAAHAEAVDAMLSDHGIAATTIDVVGFHGQTVLHRPAKHLTVQMGDAGTLASRLKIPVVFDFRAADVAAGGQGAPLVPIYHRALCRSLHRPGPIAVLNVGGVANVTFIGKADEMLACDTGPGNAVIDDFIRTRTGETCDRDGMTAARGVIDAAFVARVLEHPFFAAPPPKSLDRNDFTISRLNLSNFSIPDGAATLTALTAAAVARVVAHLPRPPVLWIVAGGGARNATLLTLLAEKLAPAKVETAERIGWSGDSIEAQAFGYLAVRSLEGLPITYPGTTGAPHPLCGGILVAP